MPAELSSPPDTLYRVGRAPDPLQFPPARQPGRNRFDNPGHGPAYRVLYVGVRRACSYEVLADLRPDIRAVGAGPSRLRSGITMEWLQSRRIGSLHLTDLTRVQKWLDFTRPETFTDFRIRFRRLILQHGFSDFDLRACANRLGRSLRGSTRGR